MNTVCTHFGLRHSPFSDTFPLKEAHLTRAETADLERMVNLIGEGKNFALTGEPGSGKSMLLRTLAEKLDSKSFRIACVPYAGQKPNAVLREICEKLKIDTAGRTPLLSRLHKSLARSAEAPYAVIILDEAHGLPQEAMNALFSLTHDPLTRTSAASIILAGHPNLEKMLALDIYASVRTRLAIRFRMNPLDEEGIKEFIAFRLALVKAPKDLFQPEAVSMIALDSKGNRRMIMNLAGNCLNLAMVRCEKIITDGLAREAADEML